MVLVDSMKRVLANAFALYLKTHNFHWNVEGPDFAQHHSFFGDLYEEIYDSIDSIAEHIRAIDAYAPGSFSRYIELSDIKDEERILPAQSMLNILKDDNNTMINSLEEAYRMANSAGEDGLSNFLQDRIDQHKKHAWMLRAFTKV